MTEREFFEKFYKLSKDKLNTKSNKNVNVKKDAMTTVIKRCKSNKNVNVKKDAMTSVIKRCRGEKKKRHKSNRWI